MMPLLVVMGISVRTAVGVALFNSVFIGIPAVTGYLAQCDIKKLLPVLLIALLTHGVGVYFGSKNASRINQKLLKTGIAVFSVGIAVCKLTGKAQRAVKINPPEEAIEQIREKTIRSALSAMRLSIKEQQSEGFFWWESAMIKKQKSTAAR